MDRIVIRTDGADV